MTLLVWSEREAGDWEACVVTAYSMGLLYGGVRMAAPYTQAQRELLEAVPDEPQNLTTTDAMSLKVYGVKLRPFSTGTVADAVTRVGVGICLTGSGSPGTQWQPGFTGGHEIFYVPTSATVGLLYDPLAPNKSNPEVIAASRIVGWARSPTVGAAREVKQWEFGPPPATEEINVITRPVREDFMTGAGPSAGQFFLQGPGVGNPKYFTVSTKVQSVGETVDGAWRLLFYVGGSGQGEYLWMSRNNLTPIAGTRNPPTGYAGSLPSEEQSADIAQLQADLAAANAAKATAEADAMAAKAKLDQTKAAVMAHVDNQTKPEEDFGKAIQAL